MVQVGFIHPLVRSIHWLVAQQHFSFDRPIGHVAQLHSGSPSSPAAAVSGSWPPSPSQKLVRGFVWRRQGQEVTRRRQGQEVRRTSVAGQALLPRSSPRPKPEEQWCFHILILIHLQGFTNLAARAPAPPGSHRGASDCHGCPRWLRRGRRWEGGTRQ